MIRVGVLGAGQLGRMLALAGYPLGIRCVLVDPSPGAPAGAVAEQIVGAYDDRGVLDALADRVDVVTYEFENVPVSAAAHVASRRPVWPPPRALEVAQDRLEEKGLFIERAIPTVPFHPVGSEGDLDRAAAVTGFPAVLKTRREGYDGKGQRLVDDRHDLAPAWEALGRAPAILERRVPFARELSILAVRGRDGATAFWPAVENHHREGILRLSLAPAPGLTPALQAAAEDAASRVLDGLGYVGVLAIEFFELDGGLLANEIAPRVHNSGHWTIEGSTTSQFENHLRAIAGWPIGPTDVRSPSAMVNLVGEAPGLKDLLAIPGAHVHLYDKEARPGRKLGHVTVTAPDAPGRSAALARVAEILDEPALAAARQR